jgi:hypothetical protein
LASLDFIRGAVRGTALIPVALQPEPAGFHANVRVPGQRFLATHPHPSNKDFKGNTYWKWAANELHAAYRGICAYTCFYHVPSGTIDHFLPKSAHPNLAYEWNNFRLASHRANSYKGQSMDVLDPFIIQPNWFALDVPSCLMIPGAGLGEPITSQVQRTIDVLHLNSDDTFVQERCDVMLAYANGDVSLDFLHRRFPFLAAEIVRQGIQHTASAIFKIRTV